MPSSDQLLRWLDMLEREARDAEADAVKRLRIEAELGAPPSPDLHYRLGSAHAQMALVRRLRRWWKIGEVA